MAQGITSNKVSFFKSGRLRCFWAPASDNQIIGFDSMIGADGGYLLIKPFYQGGDRPLLVFDTATETAQLIDTRFVVVDTQLLYIEA